MVNESVSETTHKTMYHYDYSVSGQFSAQQACLWAGGYHYSLFHYLPQHINYS